MSGLVLKYRNGECIVIRRSYEAALPLTSRFLLTLPSFALRRRGVEGKIVVGDREPEPDQTLLRALARAHVWTADLRSGKPLTDIATATSHSQSYIRTRAQLAFLSPAIQKAILEGHQPPDLTLERIVRKPIPLDWEMQSNLYRFD